MRTITRYAGVVAIVATAAVLGGCANLNSQGTNQLTPLQTQGVTTATPNPSINVASNTTPPLPFPQNKQNEPAVAIDPLNSNFVVAGANDEVDLQPCNNDASIGCPFTKKVGVSGFYFSADGGATWTQPTYTGFTGAGCSAADATCTATTGVIHTLPNYAAANLVSDGDPALAFGPQPGSNGFSWGNGVRLYYGNLTSNLGSTRSETAFKGFEAIAVSYSDDVAGIATGQTPTWSEPVIVSKQNAALFSDKDALWADNNSNSPYFGNVYMCNIAFRSAEMSPYSLPGPVIFSRSTDGGQTWSNQQISPAANNLTGNGRQGCAVRTDSQGVVYVFYLGASNKKSHPPVSDSAILMARSTNGGLSFRPARVVSTVTECGLYSSTGGDVFFDGIAGARTDSFPSVDIANGAPDNTDASDAIAVTWCDASNGVDNEQALVTISTD
ncbi:MAG: sialidase family protein, partial [Gemmatimonadota bacterium]